MDQQKEGKRFMAYGDIYFTSIPIESNMKTRNKSECISIENKIQTIKLQQ